MRFSEFEYVYLIEQVIGALNDEEITMKISPVREGRGALQRKLYPEFDRAIPCSSQ